jgi:hypothetical protein
MMSASAFGSRDTLVGGGSAAMMMFGVRFPRSTSGKICLDENTSISSRKYLSVIWSSVLVLTSISARKYCLRDKLAFGSFGLVHRRQDMPSRREHNRQLRMKRINDLEFGSRFWTRLRVAGARRC